MRRLSSITICFILVLIVFISIDLHFDITFRASGGVIYVGGTGPGNYSSIQGGINAANPGDTVFVYNGTYEASLQIDKTLNLVGEHRNSTTIKTNDSWPSHIMIIRIEADWVNISGFSISNGDPGIQILANYTSISNCHLFNNSYGVEGGWIYNLTITDNIFSLSGFGGVSLSGAGHNIKDNIFIENPWGVNAYHSNIINNTFSDNNRGVYLYGGSWNNVTGNTIIKCWEGISLYHGAHNNYITNNTIFNSTKGIWIAGVTYTGTPYSNYFIDNTISDCEYGIVIGWEAGTNEIIRNEISANFVGTLLQGNTMSGNISYNDITGNEYGFHCDQWGAKILSITNNTISYNDCGFYFENWTSNQIHHNNIINNKIQVYESPGNGNQWNDSYPSGGNFWSDYNGSDFYSGPNQDILGSDGIGDIPYVFNFSQDNYPLMEPFGNFTYLRHGWNTISIPWIQPSTKLEDVLSQINETYRAVQWFNASDKQDPWKHYSISKPSHLNDLDKIDHIMGLQIFVDDPGGAIFDFTGIIPTQNQTIPLYKGWNMVGYPSLSNKYSPDALNNLVFGTEVDAIWTYNSGAQKWEEVGDLNYFVVGKGYWIHAMQDCMWEVPL